MRKDKWIKRWKVKGSNGNTWTVAIDKDGNYGCSCPCWKFRREECHHIMQVKAGGGGEVEKSQRPEYILAQIETPKLEDGKLFVPLVAIGDTHMEATICHALLTNGYSMGEVREIRHHIPRQWTGRAIIAYIEQHGKAVRPVNLGFNTFSA